MFSLEVGADEIIDRVLNQYEVQFGESFPLYAYLDLTRGNGYDFSVKGAKRLQVFIEKRVVTNEPVKVPLGYWARRY